MRALASPVYTSDIVSTRCMGLLSQALMLMIHVLPAEISPRMAASKVSIGVTTGLAQIYSISILVLGFKTRIEQFVAWPLLRIQRTIRSPHTCRQRLPLLNPICYSSIRKSFLLDKPHARLHQAPFVPHHKVVLPGHVPLVCTPQEKNLESTVSSAQTGRTHTRKPSQQPCVCKPLSPKLCKYRVLVYRLLRSRELFLRGSHELVFVAILSFSLAAVTARLSRLSQLFLQPRGSPIEPLQHERRGKALPPRYDAYCALSALGRRSPLSPIAAKTLTKHVSFTN